MNHAQQTTQLLISFGKTWHSFHIWIVKVTSLSLSPCIAAMCLSAVEPCCKVLYDFDPENEGELSLKMGDIVTLVSQIDDNWYEGTIHGQTGYFPVTFVEVMVPLSH